MAVETNLVPLTMTFEAFGAACNELAQKCEKAPPNSAERADALDEIGRLWVDQGFTVLGQTWHDAADQCRRGGC